MEKKYKYIVMIDKVDCTIISEVLTVKNKFELESEILKILKDDRNRNVMKIYRVDQVIGVNKRYDFEVLEDFDNSLSLGQNWGKEE